MPTALTDPSDAILTPLAIRLTYTCKQKGQHFSSDPECGWHTVPLCKQTPGSKEVSLIYHTYNPWSAAGVSSKCVWEDVICTGSATVTGLCQSGCSKMAWTVAHPSLAPKHFTIISSSLNETIYSIYMGSQDCVSLWLCAAIFHLT